MTELTTEGFIWNASDNITETYRDALQVSQIPELYNNNLTDRTTHAHNISENSLQTNLPLEIIEKANYVIFPLFLVFGLTGNIITIVIMNSKQYHHMTSRLYLIPLALSDSTLLLLQVFNKNFIIELLGKDLRAVCFTCCKAFFILFRTSKMVSSWFVVFLCIERFIAVWFPLKARKLITKQVIIIQIITVIVLIGTLNSVWSYASEISDDDNQCHPDSYDRNNEAERFKFITFLTIASCLYSFIPSLILIIFTPLIIVQLTRYHKIRKTLTSNNTNRDNENLRISVMLIGIMIAFVMLVTPVILLHIIANFKGMNAFGNNGTSFSIYFEIAQILEQLNYSVNFCLYVLTSSRFRQTFFQLIGISGTSSRSKQYNNSTHRQNQINDNQRNVFPSIPKDDAFTSRRVLSSISVVASVDIRRQSLLDIYTE